MIYVIVVIYNSFLIAMFYHTLHHIQQINNMLNIKFERFERPENIMGDGGGSGNGQSRVENMHCSLCRHA